MLSVADWKNVAETAEAVATVVGLIVAGVWTYLVFVRRRQRYPRAKLRLDATLKPLSDTVNLLHVVVFIDNVGDVLLKLIGANARIEQILPLHTDLRTKLERQPIELRRPGESEIRWPTLDQCAPDWKHEPYEVEPGESENVHFDFLVPAAIRTVEIYVHFANESKRGRDIGWDLTVIYDVKRSISGRKLILLTGV